MSTIIMMHGLPCSGKTTIAKRIHVDRKNTYISTDSLRTELHKTNVFDKNDRSFVYQYLFQEVEKMLLGGAEEIIIDATFSTRERRNVIYQLCKKFSALLVIISCTCSYDMLKERMKLRLLSESVHPSLRIDTMEFVKAEQEPITNEELFGLDDVIVYTFDSENQKKEKIFSKAAEEFIF